MARSSEFSSVGLCLFLAASVLVAGCGLRSVDRVELPPAPDTIDKQTLPEPEVVTLAPAFQRPVSRPTPATPSAANNSSARATESAPPTETMDVVEAEVVEELHDKNARNRTERVRVDAMVGQINGRPLFASDFFSTMDARLRAEAERMPPEEWLQFAQSEIRLALRDRIRDELLLSEVESSLTPEQRAGVVNFVRSLRENLISESRGSEQFAQRKFLEEQGITLEEAVKAKRDEELIRSWLRRILQNKVHVPWRDIRLRYERDRAIYNPPATAIFRVIRIRYSSDVAKESVEAALAQGEPFRDIAAQYSNYETENENKLEIALSGPDYKSTTFFGPAAMNEAAKNLTPGQSAGPFEVGSSLWWIRLDEVRRISESLYDVQTSIYQQIFNERVRLAENEYFLSLLDRSGLGGANREIELMEIRLYEIAAERYLLSQLN